MVNISTACCPVQSDPDNVTQIATSASPFGSCRVRLSRSLTDWDGQLLSEVNVIVNVNQTFFNVARIAELLRSPRRRSRVTELCYEKTDEKKCFKTSTEDGQRQGWLRCSRSDAATGNVLWRQTQQTLMFALYRPTVHTYRSPLIICRVSRKISYRWTNTVIVSKKSRAASLLVGICDLRPGSMLSPSRSELIPTAWHQSSMYWWISSDRRARKTPGDPIDLQLHSDQ